MASLTDERLKEMEEEMNRFEEEILTSQKLDGSFPSNVPSRHQAHLTRNAAATVSISSAKGKIAFSGTVVPPPPPPPPEQIGPRIPLNARLPIRPPPPPPPGFLPPQLRHRPLPPRPMPPQQPPMHHMSNHPVGPRLGQPNVPPSRMMHGNAPMMPPQFHRPAMPPMGSQMPHIMNFNQNRPNMANSVPVRSTFEQSKVVYASPPVINTKASMSEKTACLGSTVTAITSKSELVVTTSTTSVPVAPMVYSSSQMVAAGIEVNVPVERIEPEKNVTATPFAVSQSSSSQQPNIQSNSKKEKKERKRKFVRMAAGSVWEDTTLGEWDLDDFRLFCGDLGNEVTDDALTRAFNKYPSFQKARVIRDKRTNKTKGFGFVSFKDPNDFTRAMREMNGKYVGNRPIKLRKSQWRDRQIDNVKKKEREKKRLGFR